MSIKKNILPNILYFYLDKQSTRSNINIDLQKITLDLVFYYIRYSRHMTN